MSNVRKGYIVVLLISLCITSCSTQNSFRTLSFFFDDVPDPMEGKESNFSDTLGQHINDSLHLSAQTTKLDFTIHQPFLQKECASCHNQAKMGSLQESQPGLCYQCHRNFETSFIFEHGPSKGGFCTECHHPHKAPEEKLLVNLGEDLCLQCHTSRQIDENIFHNIAEEKGCSSCHNPHGSNNHSLLVKGSCYKCHDDFKEKYTVLHGPVSAGLCSNCHTPHATSTINLLVRNGRDLCFYCHEPGRLLLDGTHSYIENAECTKCHNPHGGEDRFMFN